MNSGLHWQEHCSQCIHPLEHHLLLMVRREPWPMGLVICPFGDCPCHATWAAGSEPGSFEQIETTRRIIFETLTELGFRLPDQAS